MYCPHCLTEVRRQRDIEQRAIESIMALLDNARRQVLEARDTALSASIQVRTIVNVDPGSASVQVVNMGAGVDTRQVERLSETAINKIRSMRSALYEENHRRYVDYARGLDTDNPACERCGYAISALV